MLRNECCVGYWKAGAIIPIIRKKKAVELLLVHAELTGGAEESLMSEQNEKEME